MSSVGSTEVVNADDATPPPKASETIKRGSRGSQGSQGSGSEGGARKKDEVLQVWEVTLGECWRLHNWEHSYFECETCGASWVRDSAE